MYSSVRPWLKAFLNHALQFSNSMWEHKNKCFSLNTGHEELIQHAAYLLGAIFQLHAPCHVLSAPAMEGVLTLLMGRRPTLAILAGGTSRAPGCQDTCQRYGASLTLTRCTHLICLCIHLSVYVSICPCIYRSMYKLVSILCIFRFRYVYVSVYT